MELGKCDAVHDPELQVEVERVCDDLQRTIQRSGADMPNVMRYRNVLEIRPAFEVVHYWQAVTPVGKYTECLELRTSSSQLQPKSEGRHIAPESHSPGLVARLVRNHLIPGHVGVTGLWTGFIQRPSYLSGSSRVDSRSLPWEMER